MMLHTNNITKYVKKFFTILLLLLSICWILKILMQENNEIINFYKTITPKSLMYLSFSIVLGAAGVFQYVIIFKEIIHRQFDKQLSVKYLSSLFFISQIARYLPGRFFGIVYQTIKAKNKIPALIIIKSNVELMVFCTFFHFLTSILLLVICNNYYLVGFIGFLVLISLIYLYLSFDLFYIFLQIIYFIIPAKWERLKLSIPIKSKYSRENILKILFSYLTSWIFYLSAWMLFANIFPNISIKTSILMCATYTFSWVIGFVSMLTPGGLGIREAIFIYFSSFFNITNNIAFLAVFLRVWLIVIDIFLVLISIALNLNLNRKNCSDPS